MKILANFIYRKTNINDMQTFIKKSVRLIDKKEINKYYEYLLNAFRQEFLALSNRQIIEDINKESVFSRNTRLFLRQIVSNGFNRKTSLVSSGKHLCMLALKNAKFYLSGIKKLKALSIGENIVFQELIRNGFKNIEIVTIKTGFNPKKRGFSDSMVIWATKK